ncbi:TetR family transcriptional regulator [Mycobacterium sp. C31M]
MASARSLFAQRGSFATTINAIAAASRVSPGTVYRQCGGKQGLLRTLMDTWTTSDLVQSTLDQVESAESLDEVLLMLSDSYLQFWRHYDDIVQLVPATAAHDVMAAESLGQATTRHHSRPLRTAERFSFHRQRAGLARGPGAGLSARAVQPDVAWRRLDRPELGQKQPLLLQ